MKTTAQILEFIESEMEKADEIKYSLFEELHFWISKHNPNIEQILQKVRGLYSFECIEQFIKN